MSAKFAYAQWPWGMNTKEEFIQSCKDLSEVGFEYFESVKDFINTFKDDISEFKEITEEYNLRPISFYFHLTGDYDADIQELKDKIGFVQANNIKTITIQGVTKEEPATREDLIYATKTIKDYGKICAEYGIIPCIHPHHNTTIMYEDEIDYVMENTNPDEVGFAPDTAHLTAGKCNPAVMFDRYKDRIKFTHLKDLDGEIVSTGMYAGVEVYSSFRELGEGAIDFKSVFDVLKSINYDGYLCLELDESRFGHKESAKMNLEYMKKNW